ncbi:hypothetical protein GXM_04307 [Nostoc sphaeroides CCNUC1]|uniref:Uncharacterized protein n=1 Tax=Nostoc sphaeroides CCNUC1 TaxID=2653204 RepID=A0A5P8W3G3_9NOSO|nr:hypothetical protein GXM_04307 [Nostoc sphaeroides CCNUC1]
MIRPNSHKLYQVALNSIICSGDSRIPYLTPNKTKFGNLA